ncbi:hypothetical protein CXG81DRAFT_25522 [Caulochytrium protostelioides]|uniref:PRA1 family protein n=1 Tax=Caulochytrium protostelioides TaxID=1555241 RepID=A0A4P9X952_9FUNG|nr:hypothetical protein CXG81DRAFT_25522 [Caulochytrium protostelioides]|eukprot:RKP01818.1 hypothetical protein CXG81DRAFT_25522 [Caulochytrium protostelioides]
MAHATRRTTTASTTASLRSEVHDDQASIAHVGSRHLKHHVHSVARRLQPWITFFDTAQLSQPAGLAHIRSGGDLSTGLLQLHARVRANLAGFHANYIACAMLNLALGCYMSRPLFWACAIGLASLALIDGYVKDPLDISPTQRIPKVYLLFSTVAVWAVALYTFARTAAFWTLLLSTLGILGHALAVRPRHCPNLVSLLALGSH